MALGNTPRRETNISVEASKSYALGVLFREVDGSPVDLSEAEVRLVLAESARADGIELLSLIAVKIGSKQGLVQFQFQAEDLALDPGNYPYDVTLIPKSGFSTPILKGFFEIGSNTDVDTSNVFDFATLDGDIIAVMDGGDLIEITIERVDGLIAVAEEMISDFSASMTAEVLRATNQANRSTVEADRSASYANELRAWMAAVGFPFWQGTQAQYDNIPAPDPLILYLIVDEGVLP